MEEGHVLSMRADLTLESAHRRGFALVQRHAQRFISYASALDAATLATVVPGGVWTVGQTVAHVRSVLVRYTTDPRRAEGRAALAAQNDADDAATALLAARFHDL